MTQTTQHDEEVFFRLFGKTSAQLLAGVIPAETKVSDDGFAGTGMSDNQRQAWMNVFGKTPAQLRDGA